MIKEILVHADDDNQRDARFALAAEVAKAHEAHLIGLFALEYAELPGYVSAQISAELLDRARETYTRQADKVREAFESAADSAGVRAEWRQEAGIASRLLSQHGLYIDLIMVSQPENGQSGARSQSFPGELALSSGRPVVAIPYAGDHSGFGKRILIAWNGSREASRALHDALPILTRAESVVVLAVDPADEAHIPGADISAHLAHHGVPVEARHSIAPDIAVGDELLNMASDLGSDMIVMGAYGRSRLREAVFGGATQHILSHMTVPILMSH